MRIWIVLAVLATACDGDGGSGGGGVPPDQVASEISKVTCKQMFRCCTTEELMKETLGGDTEAECVAIYSGFGTIVFDVIKDSIAAGRIKYDGAAMQACLDLVGGATCSEFSKQRRNDYTSDANGCEDPFDGQVGDGGACASDADCISNYCSGEQVDFGGNVTMGACKTAPTAGKPCDEGDCYGDAWCNAGTCAAPKPDGSACTGDDECASDACEGSPGTCTSSAICDGV